MKRVFGIFEAVFDILYIVAAFAIGIALLTIPSGKAKFLAGIMALVLAGGDAFHLAPRVAAIFTGRVEDFRAAMGTGKQITSVTMTVFYVLLWHVGLTAAQKTAGTFTLILYILAAARIFLCLLPQNGWFFRYPPVKWAAIRNIPFFLMGAMAAALFLVYRVLPGMSFAVALSFAFYLPVVLLANKSPKIGMLMLPKTCAYLWMLALCLSL